MTALLAAAPVQVSVEMPPEAFPWIDVVTVAAALFAIVLSAVALRQASTLTRRSTLSDLHARLMSEDAAEGRRLIYESGRRGDDVTAIGGSCDIKRDWDRINYAITLWNTLAQFADHGMVERRKAKILWGDTVAEAWPSLLPFIEYRRQRRPDKWSSLIRFAKENGVQVPALLDPGPRPSSVWTRLLSRRQTSR